jgi:outer membrane protein assembly factor BamD
MVRRIAVLALAAGLVPGVCALATGCKSEAPSFEEVPPAEELYADGLKALEGRNILYVYRWIDYDKAIELFQSVVDNYPYSELAVKADLQIADAYFADERYDEALSYYRDFSELHPQHEEVPYTIYRSALCHERQIKATNRDQTATREAIVFLDRLLVSYPYSKYALEAEGLWRELQTRLAENIEGIADFYRSREEYEAAAERYRMLLNDYPGLGLDARVLYKLGLCYAEMDRLDEADRVFRTISTHYRDSRYAFKARKKLATNY